MRSPTMLLTVCCVAQAALGHAQTLAGKTAVVFATVAEGRQILAARDEFVERMSPFDRAARLKTARPVSEEEFLKHVGKNVLRLERHGEAGRGVHRQGHSTAAGGDATFLPRQGLLRQDHRRRGRRRRLHQG